MQRIDYVVSVIDVSVEIGWLISLLKNAIKIYMEIKWYIMRPWIIMEEYASLVHYR